MNPTLRIALVIVVAGAGFYLAHYIAHYGNEPA